MINNRNVCASETTDKKVRVGKRLVKKIIAGVMSGALIVSSLVVTPKSVDAAYAEVGTYGVGQGKQIPDHIFAPFVDIVSYVSDTEYSSAGSLSLEKMYKDTGILYYNLGFIMATTGGSITDGVVDWSWGGYSTLGENTTDTWQLDGIKESINYIRSKGGDVIVSIGGLNEGNFFQVTQDEDILFNSYMDVVQGYGLTRLDLDIEGGGQGKAQNIANAKALKRVQDATGVEIVLTLPVLPTGLTDLGLGTFEAYVENGVDVKMVNIMAMCYGSGVIYAGETYAEASVRAIDSTAQQILNTYKNNGMTISSEEAYEKVGVTVSIGEESASFPIWTTDYSQVVVDKSIASNIGMTSFWCLNRDCQQYGANSGIYEMYEHTNVFKTFMGDNAYQIPDVSDDEYVSGGEVIKEWKASSVYTEGDKVIYDGKIWQALWWTSGDTPGVATSNGSTPWLYVEDVVVEETTEETIEETTEDTTDETTDETTKTPETTTEEVTTEKATQAETETSTATSVNLEINGCQVSTINEGFRVIYSVNDPDNQVVSAGLVYGLGVQDSDMVVGSANSYVYSYQATDAGKMDTTVSQYANAQSYAMTMKFIKTAEFYNSQIDVRAYVQLKDGRYVYSDIKKFTVYDIADYLYQNEFMSNKAGHDYLFNNILSMANAGYVYKEFDMGKMLVK